MRTIGNTPVDGEVRAVASGALANGDTVIVNADGTVSVVSLSPESVTESVGSQTQYNAVTRFISTTYDESADRVVIAYRDDSFSGQGRVIAGTVSGTSISFGPEVGFNAAATENISVCYHQNAEKIVVSYKGPQSYVYAIVGTFNAGTNSFSFGTPVVVQSTNNVSTSVAYHEAAQKVVLSYGTLYASYGRMAVGTVSGTSISFGALSYFEYAESQGISSTYDPDSEQIINCYIDKGNSYKPTAVVMAVSGTSVTAGTPVLIENVGINAREIAVAYDRAAGKAVVVYGNGRAAVGTVSNTSISFGTPVSFDGTAFPRHASPVYDLNAEQIVVFYMWTDGNSGKGYVRRGTISGTSISFSARTTFLNNLYPEFISSVFDTVSGYALIAYRSNTQSNYGYAQLYRAPYTAYVTNLTSENYIGIAKGAAADTAVATVQTGCSINDAQSSLTAGQDYFVQTDGTLGLTAADPSVFAGTAVSATKLIVKG